MGTRGEYLVNMAQRVNAVVAINGGGFVDPNFNSNGALPLGITVSNGKILRADSYNGSRRNNWLYR
jgi:exopolysaccharide biosynthesis protein